ncbi:23S rRNA (uracil(1939)-C(5))-methyltransferase RlmD [Neptuniibacter sp.]|uniref:23S rRNA (uracil(1939)-C(5))-methyltransferase RlmD n=1 Tax=Neptuniibacter sp. TaxID=1962643 RepID=UPI00260FFE8C|nr:23S rRNA (uracil(1939)-C(5))-methyltransferase RlmD [Neptuniibacter sp.]MCP4597339.1 23S rRNA (uracil(1939)-C(5))-methyltransferase RlmD [Neptuniibacter sp.]
MKRKPSLFAKPKAGSKPQRSKQMVYPDVLEVESLSHEGRGIAKVDGKTIFISGALPGESVKYKIDTQHRRYDEASCTEVIKASPQRVEAKCQHYGTCGGCDLQHLNHEDQISAKQTTVIDQLDRLGHFTPETIEQPIQSPEWNYRRSCRLGINQLQRDGSAIVGFRRRGSSKLTHISDCPVLAEPLNEILKALPSILETEEDFKGITHAELSEGDESGALTLRIKKPLTDHLSEKLQQLASEHNFSLFLDDGQKLQRTDKTAELFYQIENSSTQVYFEPGDFIQVNASVNNQMINRAITWLDLSKDDRVLDLFCGVGNFTLPIAGHVAAIVGVEGVEEMVERANQNASRNQLSNCSFYRANLSKDLRALPWYKQGFNKIILDPPRTGALEVIKQLEKHQADMILYVSCNPAALARDGAELIKQGYRPSRFCVMDMFPHTSHVESLVLFER